MRMTENRMCNTGQPFESRLFGQDAPAGEQEDDTPDPALPRMRVSVTMSDVQFDTRADAGAD
jgi:hypothetical protein